jgi:hypothetical protein
MRAKLITACGCTRYMDIPRPVPDIILPLRDYKPMNYSPDAILKPNPCPERRFKYYNQEGELAVFVEWSSSSL